MAKFNLIEEPWIPVLRNGRVEEVGIREALVNAHTITRIETPFPLEEAALHRLLLAVLYRALPPVRDKYEALALWERGEFDRESIEGYLERYRDRFYLFHEATPFLQIPDLPQEDLLPWSKLLPQLANGNNPTLFDHTVDKDPPLASYPEVARALLVHQAFAPGGLLRRLGVTSAKDAPLARPAAFLAMGTDLFQTLVLNLVPQEDPGVPIWERKPLRTQDVKGYAIRWPLSGVGVVYVWPSRGVLLVDEGQGVRWMGYGPGVEPQEVAWRDPMVAYRKDNRGAIFPLRLSMERSFWRDFGAMLPAAGGAWPAVLRHAGELEEEGAAFTLRVLGQVSDQAKILDIRREVYPIPKGLVTPKGELLLQRALQLAEDAAKGLRGVAWRVAQGVLGSRDASELQNFANSLPLLSLYWAQLDLDFTDFLSRLHQEGILDLWRNRILKAAQRAWEETRRFVGTEARHLRALAESERAFRGVVAELREKEVKG
ncbi:type I-E CRISPR-associated protein Cse1/CasA [Thermus caldifontis]|uniref:type I-E CRISPR-associated protein Cse1/CasA n=1 Tax=Thermus caldifontis TaxID=1930763 RepID=UPI000DF22551|nr:type I-E CRISPR-associated protein Cse1/CasA [Thermus caldifontis]